MMNSEAPLDVSACPACQRDTCPGDCMRPRFIGSDEVLREPVIKPIVGTPPYLYPGCLTVEVGESNSGKTFDAIRLAALINRRRRGCGLCYRFRRRGS